MCVTLFCNDIVLHKEPSCTTFQNIDKYNHSSILLFIHPSIHFTQLFDSSMPQHMHECIHSVIHPSTHSFKHDKTCIHFFMPSFVATFQPRLWCTGTSAGRRMFERSFFVHLKAKTKEGGQLCGSFLIYIYSVGSNAVAEEGLGRRKTLKCTKRRKLRKRQGGLMITRSQRGRRSPAGNG